MIELYGIPNCSTVKKARQWLETNGLEYQFHDFKKEPPTKTQLMRWCKIFSWEKLLNVRGTTWRKLDAQQKEGLNQTKAMQIMLEHPSIIKRPVLLNNQCSLVGFEELQYQTLF